MSELKEKDEKITHTGGRRLSRKSFLKFAGASAAAAATLGLYGCKDDDNPMMQNPDDPMDPDSEAVNLGSGDTGILNYAYALEQLEAAFYIQVIDNPYADITDEEMTILDDLRMHEVAHRDFFKAALADNAIPDLEVDFSAIDFSNRASVLGAAKTFEDLGVSAYNGAGQLLTDTELLLTAGKIVSVEARHAAAIRSLLDPKTGSFAGDDIIDMNGLDVINDTNTVLMAASDFIVTEIDASNLPQPNN